LNPVEEKGNNGFYVGFSRNDLYATISDRN
jgi:hypothetical protein